jgi:hypothetical protein
MAAFSSPYVALPALQVSIIPAKAGIHTAVTVNASAVWIPGQEPGMTAVPRAAPPISFDGGI